MNVFISHSSKDAALFEMIQSKLKARKFHVLEKRHGLEWYSSLTARGKQKINICNLGIVLFSPQGRGSYIVHQEAAYMNMIGKDHFVLESNGGVYTITAHIFENELPTLEQESFHENLLIVKMILRQLHHNPDHTLQKMVFHTDMVLE